MGQELSNPIIYKSPTQPDWEQDSKFDPNEGFERPRKPRVMKATKEEMISARLPLKFRDYCAHLLINYNACQRDRFPYTWQCKHQKHEYEHCQYEDFLIIMKEYEREKRLLQLKAKQEKAESH